MPYRLAMSPIWAASSRVGEITSARVAQRLAAGKLVQDRQQEGRGLPGAGLSAGDEVAPLEHNRNSALLH